MQVGQLVQFKTDSGVLKGTLEKINELTVWVRLPQTNLDLKEQRPGKLIKRHVAKHEVEIVAAA